MTLGKGKGKVASIHNCYTILWS